MVWFSHTEISVRLSFSTEVSREESGLEQSEKSMRAITDLRDKHYSLSPSSTRYKSLTETVHINESVSSARNDNRSLNLENIQIYICEIEGRI